MAELLNMIQPVPPMPQFRTEASDRIDIASLLPSIGHARMPGKRTLLDPGIPELGFDQHTRICGAEKNPDMVISRDRCLMKSDNRNFLV
jgi:hypothetical protein